jgi:hypothetical protein
MALTNNDLAVSFEVTKKYFIPETGQYLLFLIAFPIAFIFFQY